MASVDNLSASQRAALEQLQAVTNGGDAEVAISVLESVSWDVQRAADIIFDTNPSAPLSINKSPYGSTSSTSDAPEDVETDDPEHQGLLSGRPAGREFRRVAPANPTVSILLRPLRLIVAILAIPYTLIRAILRALHIPIPLPPVSPAFSIFGLGLHFGSGHRPSGSSMPMSSIRDPKAAARRWVQSLEEETGCMSWSRASASNAEGEASGVASGSSEGLTRRQSDTGGEGNRTLPDFLIGSYEEFAKLCGNENGPRIGCIVIVSEEHDDVAEFKRSTLTDPEFVRLLHENNFLVWGGDIRDRDAWSASQKLQATTYPFVAFIALQPRRSPLSSGSTQTPTLTILSRHQGPSIPASTAPTSARTLVGHITEQLLPRVTPFLERTRAQAAERAAVLAVAQRERALREEQDRAFAESARKDKERIERKIAEEKKAQEEAARRSLEEERQKQEEQRRVEEQARWEEKRMEWRRWGRRSFIPREPRPGEQGRGKTIRVGVRMPDGRRGVRFFGEADSLTAVYTFVDALFIPAEGSAFSSSNDPVVPPEGEVTGEEGLISAMAKAGKSADMWWGFTLASTYPRREILWQPGKTIGEIDGLRGGGQLVVEMVDNGSRRGKGKAISPGISVKSAGSSDEYESESE